MERSFIGGMRRISSFMRVTAAAVAVTFSMLVLAPAAAAAREAPLLPAGARPGHENAPAQLSKAVMRAKRLIERSLDRLDQAAGIPSEIGQLRQIESELRRLDGALSEHFARIGERIEQAGVPGLILQRHRETLERYEQEMAYLLGALDEVVGAPDARMRRSALEALLAELGGKKLERARHPFDPERLPSFSHDPLPSNAPRKSPAAFHAAGLFDNPLLKLAALGDFVYDGLSGAGDPAYLEETPEVTLTQAIRDKAAELGYQPVRIYQWVRNHIEWVPSWGAIQDADMTLSAGRGNAFDIASLTIALLRASGIPARYVHGTIEVSEDRFRNWAGGFEDAVSAANFAASGGIPTGTVVEGGRVTHVQLEHVWVEAAIDYFPSRGAVNRAADAWVVVDPSFKQYEFLDGLDVVGISGLDPEQLARPFADSGRVDETESWVTGLDPSILQNAQEQAGAAMEDYIADNLTNPTVGDVIGGRRKIVREYPVLPAGPPYRPLVVGARYAKLPGGLRHRLEIAFANTFSYLDQSVTLDWPAVNNRKVTLSFRPATEADEQALASFLPEGEIIDPTQLPASIPAYLIQVVPEVKVAGEVVKTGQPMALGEDLMVSFTLRDPSRGSFRFRSPVVAGSYLSLGAVGGSLSPAVLGELRTRVEQTTAMLESGDARLIEGLTREDVLGDLFHAGTLGYFAQYAALAYMAGLAQNIRHELAPSVGTYGYVPRVDYFLGFPLQITPGGVEMDMDQVARFNGADGYTPEVRRRFNIQTGILSSALEHAVPEQMFVTPENPGEAVSAVKAIQKAMAQGQRIYHLTPDNRDTTLPEINHDSRSEISQALNVGMEVITHTDDISVPGWSGAGYIILDPETGEGAYKIARSLNGGFSDLANVLFGVAAGFDVHWEADVGVTLSKNLGRLGLIFQIVSTFYSFNELVKECGPIVSAIVVGILFAFDTITSKIMLSLAWNTAWSSIWYSILFVVAMTVVMNFIATAATDLSKRLCVD